jgi:hypothetical protein
MIVWADMPGASTVSTPARYNPSIR